MPIWLIVILSVLAFLLLLLLLALFLPAHVYVEYADEKLAARIQVLFIIIKLYPRPEKKQKKQPEPEPEEKEEEEKREEKRKRDVSVTIDKIIRILKTAGSALKQLLKDTTVTVYKLEWPIYNGDAAETAIAYGQFQIFLGTVLAVLQQYMKITLKSTNIFADYDNKHEKERCIYCKIGATPFIIVSVTLYVLERLKREKLI